MHTANGAGSISVELDGRQIVSPVMIASSYDYRDSIAWRQWHHWNRTDSLTQIEVRRGIHTLTFHIAGHGNMNFDYLEFKKE